MPYLPGGSLAVPLRTTRLTCATGTLCVSTIQTGRPLDSFCFWIFGRFSGAGGPGCGGCERSGACCATSVAPSASADDDDERALHHLSPPFSGSMISSTRLSSGRYCAAAR